MEAKKKLRPPSSRNKLVDYVNYSDEEESPSHVVVDSSSDEGEDGAFFSSHESESESETEYSKQPPLPLKKNSTLSAINDDQILEKECSPVLRSPTLPEPSTPEAETESRSDSCTGDHETLGEKPASPPAKRVKRKYAAERDDLPAAMKKFLKDVRDFFSETINLQRMSAALTPSTVEKTDERLRCYLGYVLSETSRELNETVFEDPDLVQAYLNYLEVKEKRGLNPGTIANHVSSLLYALKFLHKHAAPRYEGVTLISQLRNISTDLQKESDRLRPTTTKELDSLGKWLKWNEILECFALQRRKFEVTKGSKKAKELMDLVLLAIYSHMPPSRGLEIRTLTLFQESPSSTFNIRLFKGKNVLVQHVAGNFTFHFQHFKTSKSYGHDEVSIIERETELTTLMTDYLANYRSSLTSKDSGDYIFLSEGFCFAQYCDTLDEK